MSQSPDNPDNLVPMERTERMDEMVWTERQVDQALQVYQGLTGHLVHKGVQALAVPLALREQLARLGLLERLAETGRRGNLAAQAQQALTDLWDLLDLLDRMELLDPREFREFRAQLVRLEFRALQGSQVRLVPLVFRGRPGRMGHPVSRESQADRLKRKYYESKE